MVQWCHDARELGYVQLGWFILFYKFVSFFQSSTCFPLENCIWKPWIGQDMASHSSILSWRSPWVEEPGGLQSTGSQRVGHNWLRKHTHTHTHTHTHALYVRKSPNSCDSKFEVFLSTPDHPKCWQTCKVSQIFTSCVGHINCYNIFPE